MKVAIMGKIHLDGISVLKENNLDYFEINNFDEKNLIDQLSSVDGIVIRTANLNSEILSNCKNLKIVSRHGVGYDNIDSNYLKDKNIALAITSTSNAVSVSEHVMTMLLTLTKNIYKSDNLVKSGNFSRKSELPNFFELYKKNIFILGFGRIGKALAKRCKGFEMNVYIYDPFVDNKLIKNFDCYPISKEEGFKLADYISVHLPLNEKTRDLISYKEFESFKKNLILINTARGGIVNEDALYKALKNNVILSAGLDVFETEPPEKDNPLLNLDNIILSPHNSALTLECRKRMSVEACENVSYFLLKKEMLNRNNIIDI